LGNRSIRSTHTTGTTAATVEISICGRLNRLPHTGGGSDGGGGWGRGEGGGREGGGGEGGGGDEGGGGEGGGEGGAAPAT